MSRYSRRLERVRGALRFETVRAFVEQVNEAAATPFPYATASRYHRDREPPVAYLVAVADAFGLTLDELLGRPPRRGAPEPVAWPGLTDERRRRTYDVRLIPGTLTVAVRWYRERGHRGQQVVAYWSPWVVISVERARPLGLWP